MAIEKDFAMFSADLKMFAETINVDFARVVKNIAFRIQKSAQQNSPVDTGRFRASWGVSIYQVPEDDEGEPPAPKGKKVPISASRKRTATLHELNFDPYASVIIYNNLPYAEALENGHSGQAPRGVLANVEVDVLTQIEEELKTILGS